MNPYEPPRAGEEPIPVQRKRKLIVIVGLAVAAGMIIGGVPTYYMVRLGTIWQVQAARQAEQAAKAEAFRAREAALKAESERDSLVP